MPQTGFESALITIASDCLFLATLKAFAPGIQRYGGRSVKKAVLFKLFAASENLA
jgi:hypothetical protein